MADTASLQKAVDTNKQNLAEATRKTADATADLAAAKKAYAVTEASYKAWVKAHGPIWTPGTPEYIEKRRREDVSEAAARVVNNAQGAEVEAMIAQRKASEQLAQSQADLKSGKATPPNAQPSPPISVDEKGTQATPKTDPPLEKVTAIPEPSNNPTQPVTPEQTPVAFKNSPTTVTVPRPNDLISAVPPDLQRTPDDATSDVAASLELRRQEARESNTFTTNPKPVLAAEVREAQAAGDQRPLNPLDPGFSSEFTNNPKPVLNEEVGLAQAASGTVTPGFTSELTAVQVAQNNIAASVNATRASVQTATTRQTRSENDWRVRLSLASQANYLYRVAGQNDVLYPLASTDGVIFPYTPQISNSYRANYDPTDIAHANYKQYFYKNSSVEEMTITADFTAQDTSEANYVLAVIHFFRSVTKMFYGQDGKNGGPTNGTPPPLCYLHGYGQFQYNNHPLLISNFSYTLPNDVDYLRAGSTAQWPGENVTYYAPKPEAAEPSTTYSGTVASWLRMKSSGLNPGGISSDPQWNPIHALNDSPTYVPTKLQVTVTCIPIVTRFDISNNFSVEEYATGALYKKGYW